MLRTRAQSYDFRKVQQVSKFSLSLAQNTNSEDVVLKVKLGTGLNWGFEGNELATQEPNGGDIAGRKGPSVSRKGRDQKTP